MTKHEQKATSVPQTAKAIRLTLICSAWGGWGAKIFHSLEGAEAEIFDILLLLYFNKNSYIINIFIQWYMLILILLFCPLTFCPTVFESQNHFKMFSRIRNDVLIYSFLI